MLIFQGVPPANPRKHFTGVPATRPHRCKGDDGITVVLCRHLDAAPRLGVNKKRHKRFISWPDAQWDWHITNITYIKTPLNYPNVARCTIHWAWPGLVVEFQPIWNICASQNWTNIPIGIGMKIKTCLNPSKIKQDLTNGPLGKVQELLDTQV